ncbi:MAG: TatD family hydrolase [Oscillochloris sp.]|nr:TatD family hydrolase [Oscillochloris sp.]
MSSLLRLIDTHTHVATGQFDPDRAEVLARAAEAGVARMIEVGYDIASSQAALALAESQPQIYAVVGIQPNHVHEVAEGWLDQLRSLAAHPKVVGIGEIGLDYHWMKAPPDLQEHFFRTQLTLARELGLPVVIHSRDAQDDTLHILSDAARGQPGIMHSFSGSWDYARACLEIGFMLSFSGPLTFPKATELHEAARMAPLEMVLTETDSPYLSPHPHRGKRNEPARVRLVAESLAALRTMSLEEVANHVWHNAERVFRLQG